MGITIGPVDWWVASPEGIDSLAISCPVGTVLPDGSTTICKAGGVAWIVAPATTTQVSATWNGTTTELVGDKCCVCDWSSLCSAMVSAGFNPGDWFVPSVSQLQNPGFVCRTNWDSFSSPFYFSSTEIDATGAYGMCLNCTVQPCGLLKSGPWCVRAFRCVTY